MKCKILRQCILLYLISFFLKANQIDRIKEEVEKQSVPYLATEIMVEIAQNLDDHDLLHFQQIKR